MSDAQIIKIERDDNNEQDCNDEISVTNVADSECVVPTSKQSPSHSNLPSTPSKVKSESGQRDDDGQSESSTSTIPNEQSDTLGLNSDLSNLISGTNQQHGTESGEIDTDVSVKLEALTENEMELEITGVEPGRPIMAQDDWDPNISMGMNFDPTGATGDPGDMSAQGYSK